MSDKLNLVVNFMGIDKLSGSMKNIMMSSKASARELKSMKDEARSLEKELGKVRKELSAGIAGGSGNLTELVQKERELTRAVAATNNQLQERGQRMARIQSIENKAGKVASGAGIGGAAMTVGVTAPLMAFGQSSIQAFLESQDAIGAVNASLASMGRQSEFTSAQLAMMAQSEMKKSLYDDDQILRDVTATMLTFGEVQGDVFARGQAAAIDLSALLKKDLQSSSIMVGKALQNPLKGLTALGKAGVTFDDSQKAMIKSMVKAGNVAGAQKIILAELEKQVRGQAEAARAANPGAAAKQSYDELQENVGGKLLPLQMKVWTMMGKVADAFNNASPAMQNFALYAGIGAAVLGPLLLGISGIAAGIGMLAPLIAGISLPILGIGAAIGIAAYLIYTHWGRIKAAFMGGVALVQAQWQYLKSGVTGLMTFLQTLPARLAMIGRNMIMGLVTGLKAAGGMVWSTLKNIVMGGINGVKAFLGIKSPSRVFMALGGYVSEGMALGIDKGGRKAVSAAGRLATGVATAGALSMAPVAAAGGAQGVSATTGTGGVHIQRVEIVISGDTSNPRGLAEQIMRELKQLQQIQARGAYDDGD